MTQTTQAVLLKRVQARQVFLEQVTQHLPKFIADQGKRTRHEVHDCHTHNEYKLDNFLGLSFSTEGSFTMYGGDNLKVWRVIPGKDNQLVLNIDWWNSDLSNCRLYAFDDAEDWKRKLLKILKDQRTALDRAFRQAARAKSAEDRKAAAASRKAAAELRTRQQLESLQTDAKRLLVA